MRYAELAGFELYAIVYNYPDSKTPPRLATEKELKSSLFVLYTKSPELSFENEFCFSERDIERNDSLLVQVVEELGDLASGTFSCLKVVEIPDNIEWEIEEYDGMEWVSEKHRSWS
jgi:hypothetical protein